MKTRVQNWGFVILASLWGLSCVLCLALGYGLGHHHGLQGYFYVEEEAWSFFPWQPKQLD